MGDRANIQVKEGDSSVFLYTHWDGHKLPSILHRALSRRARWNDGPYLSRIIFSEMIRDNIDEDTGYGIWSSEMDNEHPVLVVDIDKQEVNGISFDDFIKKKKVSWNTFPH